MHIPKDVLDDSEMRKELGKKSLKHFAAVYFPELFKFEIPKFHHKWYRLLSFRDFSKKTIFKFLVLVGFRDSAKTSLAKIKVVRDICYKRKKLIGYVCFEKESSGAALFDVATWLQTNPFILKDFGELFKSSDASNAPEKKTINNFVTNNGVKLTAMSIRQSVRGKIFEFQRPDCYVIDDFENNITKRSGALTRKAIDFFKELIPGLAPNAEVIFVCNKISDIGSVQWLLDTAENNPDFRVSEVPVIQNGKSVWPERFVLTDEEAAKINAHILDPDAKIVSLESLKRSMNADGQLTFEQEMLLQPLVEGERFFDTKKIDTRIEVLKNKKWQSNDPQKEDYFVDSGDWKTWIGAYKLDHEYVIGADVSEGYGRDSSVIQVLDITTGDQVKEFESNRCPPAILAKLIYDEGKTAGHCRVAPERNSIGVAVITELRSLDYPEIYREKTIDKVSDRPVHKYGWQTNSKTKATMLFEFKRDFEAGHIGINSLPLLREMRNYTKEEVTTVSFDPEMSQHFDRVIAMAIAWQMRKHLPIRGFA